jgi:hypothetical protein
MKFDFDAIWSVYDVSFALMLDSLAKLIAPEFEHQICN